MKIKKESLVHLTLIRPDEQITSPRPRNRDVFAIGFWAGVLVGFPVGGVFALLILRVVS